DLSQSKRKRLPAYPLPVLRLARLAVDERHQGWGVANALLRAVFTLAQRMAADVGCLGVIVDAKPEAVGFYEKLGFMVVEAAAGPASADRTAAGRADAWPRRRARGWRGAAARSAAAATRRCRAPRFPAPRR